MYKIKICQNIKLPKKIILNIKIRENMKPTENIMFCTFDVPHNSFHYLLNFLV